jgi:glycosyltransferase involved in cell wall biosynthesis
MAKGCYITHDIPDGLVDPGKGYILWLASWYPTKTVPYNGDFIQRHAYAASIYRSIILVHTIHDPYALTDVYYEITEQKNLKEIIIFFRDAGTSSTFQDKLRYNFRYYQFTRNFFRSLFKKISLPLFVHVHVPMKCGAIALWLNRKWRIPYLLSEHSASYLDVAPDNYFSRSFYYRKNVSRIFKRALAVTNVSVTVGNILQELFSIRNIFIIRNAVDESLFFYKKPVPGKFRFIHISTMNYQKNSEGLLRAFEQFSENREDVELSLVGPMTEEVKKKIQESGAVSKIICRGEVTYEDVAGFMQASNCFVLFSRYENFPCVIIEALCCGLPVITSDAGGSGEGIDENNGIIVPSENQEALISAMQAIMEKYHMYNREEIASRARSFYGYPAIGREFQELYRHLNLVKD